MGSPLQPFSVDDRSPLVSLGPTAWVQQPGAPQEFNSSTSTSDFSGQTATLTFSGSSVAAFGTRVPSNVNLRTLCTVDGNPSTVSEIGPPSGILYNQLLCNVTQLSSGTHTIVLTNLQDDDHLHFDYFLITPIQVDNNPPPNQAPSSNPTPTTTGPSSSTTTPGNPNATTSPSLSLSVIPSSTQSGTPTSSASSTSGVLGSSTDPTGSASPQIVSDSEGKVPTGAIVGAAIGGTAVLLLLVLLAFFLYRKRSRNRIVQGPPSPDMWNQNEVVEPFRDAYESRTELNAAYGGIRPPSYTPSTGWGRSNTVTPPIIREKNNRNSSFGPSSTVGSSSEPSLPN